MAQRIRSRLRSTYQRNQAGQAHRHAVGTARAQSPSPTHVASPGAHVASPAPATTTPAPASPASPLPWDARYEQTVGGINRDRGNALAGLTAEEQRAKQEFGFDDPSNPFNRLKMLEQSFQNSQRGNTNSFANQGQLYSSALQDTQDATQKGYSQDRDTLRRSYDDILSGIQSRRIGVNSGADDAIGDAGWDRTQTALDNRPDPATTPAPAAPAAAAKPYKEQPGKDSKGNPGVWHIWPNGRKVFVKK